MHCSERVWSQPALKTGILNQSAKQAEKKLNRIPTQHQKQLGVKELVN